MDEYPGKEVIGRQVTVHLDTGEKGKYTVEIDELLEEIRRERAAQPEEKPAEQPEEKPDEQPEEKPAVQSEPEPDEHTEKEAEGEKDDIA